MKLLFVTMVFVTWVGLLGSAKAEVITLDQTNRGWITEQGRCSGHCPSATGNYFTGFTSNAVHRSFYIFDLSLVTESIQSAEFSFTANSNLANYEIFDITSDFSLFSNHYNAFDPTGLALFDDLGSGVSYGKQSFNHDGSYDSVMTAVLNIDAISAINLSRGGFFGFGIDILNPPTGGSIGSGSGGSSTFTQLVLNTGTPPVGVHAPYSLVLFSFSVVFLFVRRNTRL